MCLVTGEQCLAHRKHGRNALSSSTAIWDVLIEHLLRAEYWTLSHVSVTNFTTHRVLPCWQRLRLPDCSPCPVRQAGPRDR